MESSEIISEPVAQIVDGLLRSVLENVGERSDIAVIDLENDSPLVKSDDDDITIVTEKKQSQQEDNEVEIVSAQITHPIRKPSTCLDADTIDVDLLEDIDVQVPNPPPLPPNTSLQQDAIDVDTLDNVEAIAAPPSLQPSIVPVGPLPIQTEPVPDIVECVSSGTTEPVFLANLKCHSCDAGLLRPRLLTRCKHLLCALCRMQAVTNMSSKEKPVASEVRRLPVCVVPRCGAPLSTVESLEALAPDVADSAFQDSYQAFCNWTQAAPENEVTGAANVEFPSYADSEIHITPPKKDEHTFEAAADPHSLLEDDFAAAVNPLWVWDSERLSSAPGEDAWLCVACGKYDEPDAIPPTASIRYETADNEPPDVPTHPHCAYARALAVLEYVKSLTEAQEERSSSSRSKRSRRSTPKKSSKSRKRYRSVSSVQASKRQKTGFAKGTGYAGRRGSEWKGASHKMLEKKNRVDSESAFWLRRLRCVFLIGSEGLHTWPGFMRILLKEIKLVNQLAFILINESIMDVQERIPVFVSALRVVHAMTESPQLRSLIVHPIGDPTGRSIAELVESLSQQAAFLTTGTEHDSLPVHTAVLIKQIRRCIRVINRHGLLEKRKSRVHTAAVSVDDVSVEQDGKDGNQGSENANEDNNSGLKVQDDLFEEDKAAYIQEMRPHQFKAVPGLIKSSTFKSKAEQYDQSGVPHPRRQRRIATEVASLLSSLPLSWSSSILIRVDEDRYDILRACIFGPEDTPYDSGAFVFDIYLPLDYPINPPKFSLLTTGAGKVRFNPNLYSNGKVCLSLLGTWSGPSWNQSSTILQVLVSIQSLIFVADPYFNEPGYESQIGTSTGKQSSELYNSRIRYYSAFHAIQTQIRKPPPEFAEGFATHFRLKHKYIKSKLTRWFPSAAEGAKQGNEEGNASANGHCNNHVTADPILQSLHMVLANASSSPAPHAGNYQKQNFSHFESYEPGRNYRSSTTMTSAGLKSIFEDLDACASETPPGSVANT